MSDVATTAKIWLKAGSSEKYVFAEKFYPVWAAKGGKTEYDVNDVPSEEYSDSTVKWKFEGMIKKTEADPDRATTGWFLNTFLKGYNSKSFKEDGGSWKSAALEESTIPFDPEEYAQGFANIKFTLIEK